MANFIELDESKLPKTKGKRIDGMRFYEVDGKAFPSITTVLGSLPKPGLDQWRKNVGEEAAKWEMNRAARRGKVTHTLVEEYLQGKTPSTRDVLPLGLFALLKPYLAQIDNVHCLETILYSKKLTVADGGIGPNTLAKVAEYVEEHGLAKAIDNYQEARQSYYEKLSTFATFGRGWTRRVDETTQLAKTMIS